MSQIIGLVSKPFNPLDAVSNCKVAKEGQKIVLIDDTSERPFVQSHAFANITADFKSVIQKIPANGSMRVISICSEFSTPSISYIKDCTMQMISQRYPPTNQNVIPISAGLVYDDEVFDFFSLRNGRSNSFQMMDADNVYDALDLIDFSFKRFKRFKESVFVLHIGEEDFFEWVIVPSADNFVPTPSISGLPPNEKLIFILKLFPSLNEKSVERYRRISNVFKVVSDTFNDIPTLWICHIAKNVSFKSNASLFRIMDLVENANQNHIVTERSQLFQVRSYSANIDNESNFDAISATNLNDSQRKEALMEEQQLRRGLRMQTSDSSSFGVLDLSDSSSNNFEMSDDVLSRLSAKKRFSNRNRGKGGNISDASDVIEEIDEFGNVIRKDGGKSTGRNGKANGNKAKNENADGELTEEQKKAKEIYDREAENLNALKNNKSKKKQGKKNDENDAQNANVIVEDEATRLEREKREAEENELRSKVNELKDRRRKKLQDKMNQRKHKSETSETMTKSSLMSKRDRITQKMQKMHQQREAELELEYEEDEEEEDKYENGKRLSKQKIREKELLKLQFLVMKAKKLARSDNVTASSLRAVDDEMMVILDGVDTNRAKTEEEIVKLRKQLKEKRKKHESNVEDLKDMRLLFIDTHNKNVQVKVSRQWTEKTKHRKNPSAEEYERTIRLLKLEISNVKNDITSIKMRDMRVM